MTESFEETINEFRTKKVVLKCYGHTSREDAVCFFQCYTGMMKELKPEVKKASSSKQTDAETLFKAMDKMLIGTANANFNTVLTELTKDPKSSLEHFPVLFKVAKVILRTLRILSQFC